jgi:imidazolonepropionase-like amidohydrolase
MTDRTPERTLLRNGRILTCSGDPAERPIDGDLLVEGDTIAAVAPGGLEIDRASTRVIELGGATVVPGMADAHVHISWPLDFVFDHGGVAASDKAYHALDCAGVVRTFLESGYTLIIGAGVLQPHDDVLTHDFIERGVIPGPRMVPSGPMITAPGCLGAEGGMMDVGSTPTEMREIVKKQVDAGARALKIFVSGDGIVPEFPSDDLYMDDDLVSALVDEADRHGAFVTAHARGGESIALAARNGVKIIHHACFLDDQALTELEARRDDVWVCPGLHYLRQMVGGAAEPWGMTQERLDASGYATELEANVASLQKLHAAGVRILAGGDFGHQWTMHGTYAAELQAYVELVGMSPIEALHTATRHLGPLVGLDWGQVREGYLADLVVLDGDPTADVTVLQDPARRRFVMKDGEIAWVNPTVYP